MWPTRVINFFGNSMAASLLESLPHLFISQCAPRKRVKFWQCLLKSTTNSNAVAIKCRNSLPSVFLIYLPNVTMKLRYFIHQVLLPVMHIHISKRKEHTMPMILHTLQNTKRQKSFWISVTCRLLHAVSHCSFHPSGTWPSYIHWYLLRHPKKAAVVGTSSARHGNIKV